MTRRWDYLIFPAATGDFAVPSMTTSVLSPAGVRVRLRCEGTTLAVRAASPEEPPPLQVARKKSWNAWPFAIAVAAIAVIGVAWMRWLRGRDIRARVRGLVRPTPVETRAAVDEYLAARGIEPSTLLREPTERGDAYRSLRSLLDALERDRLVAGPREIAQRVRDLVVT